MVAHFAFSPPFPNHFSEAKQGSQTFLLKTVTALEFEDAFCSKIRMKILKLLFQLGQLNTSDLAHRLGANYETTLRHLAFLEKEGLVTQRLSGRTKFFRFTNSLKARAISKLLEEWEGR
jgi:DNA-binding transcriptional ArsR family regulator